jgi:dCTP deaminase
MPGATACLFPELFPASTCAVTSGVLPSQKLREAAAAGYIRSAEGIADEQIQPSSIDLRLGPVAYRVRASFLSTRHSTVADKLATFNLHEIDLRQAAVFERGCIYIVPLKEELALPEKLSGKCNPKSTTGRLDIFTRVITDYGIQFDIIRPGYIGPLYAEVAPRTFGVLVRENTRLTQLRLTLGSGVHSDSELTELQNREALVYDPDEQPAEPHIRNGLRLSVDLQGVGGSEIIGYRARKHASIIDLEKVRHYAALDYWEPIPRNAARQLILDPEDFYILASREKVRIPADYAAEMVPYDPSVGEFRIHYAGFFDPGFGCDEKGTRAVLEVRSHEVPFLLEDGQVVASLIYERLLAPPERLYGPGIGSSYQSQGLALSKHFKL